MTDLEEDHTPRGRLKTVEARCAAAEAVVQALTAEVTDLQARTQLLDMFHAALTHEIRQHTAAMQRLLLTIERTEESLR